MQRSDQLTKEISDLDGGTNASCALLQRGMQMIIPSSLQKNHPSSLDGTTNYQNLNEILERIKESGVFYTAWMIFREREEQTPIQVSLAGSSQL